MLEKPISGGLQMRITLVKGGASRNRWARAFYTHGAGEARARRSDSETDSASGSCQASTLTRGHRSLRHA